MDREALAMVAEPDTPLFPPFPILLTGLGLIGAAWLMGMGFPGPTGIRVLFLVLGLLATGSALALHLSHADRDTESRLFSAALWLLGTAVTVVARYSLDPAWDSFALLLSIGTVVSVAAAILTALPWGWRRLALSALIVFHFVGILVAVVNVPPPGGAPPWMAHQLWMWVYRPYLTVTNLNNGYHFYAPEPGPCSLLYFRVEFADGYSKWVRIPDHEACRSHVERRRLGALATSIGQTMPTPPGRLEMLIKRRSGELPLPGDPPLAVSPKDIPPGNMPMAAQYREPSIPAKMMLSSFARYVARTTQHPLGNIPVTGVKIYHVEFHNPLAQDFAAGQEPLDPILYLPFYQGEYDAKGELKPECLRFRRDADGRPVEPIQDPLLYWLIPIYRIPEEAEGKNPAALAGASAPSGKPLPAVTEGKLKNFVYIHAGDKDKSEEALP